MSTRIWLNIDTPLLRVQVKGFQCSLLTEPFQLILMFSSSIVSDNYTKYNNEQIGKELKQTSMNTHLWPGYPSEYLLFIQEPNASRTALLAKFSDAISSSPYVCLCFSFFIIENTWKTKQSMEILRILHHWSYKYMTI